MKTIFVSGGSGFIGRHLIPALLQQGHSVVALVRSPARAAMLRPHPRLSLCSEAGVEETFSKNRLDGVIHLATAYGRAGVGTEVFDCNVRLPSTLLALASQRRLEFFVNTDTFFTKNNANYSYLSEYSRTKREFYEVLKRQKTPLKSVNLRLEHVYGEGDNDQKFAMQIVRHLLEGRAEIPLTDGHQRRDFIHVSDVIAAYIEVVSSIGNLGIWSEYEVGTGVATSIREFVRMAQTIIGAKSALQFGALETRAGEFSSSVADTTSLRALGWSALLDLRAGLQQMITYENERFSPKQRLNNSNPAVGATSSPRPRD